MRHIESGRASQISRFQAPRRPIDHDGQQVYRIDVVCFDRGNMLVECRCTWVPRHPASTQQLRPKRPCEHHRQFTLRSGKHSNSHKQILYILSLTVYINYKCHIIVDINYFPGTFVCFKRCACCRAHDHTRVRATLEQPKKGEVDAEQNSFEHA